MGTHEGPSLSDWKSTRTGTRQNETPYARDVGPCKFSAAHAREQFLQSDRQRPLRCAALQKSEVRRLTAKGRQQLLTLFRHTPR
jgi:hypothetical protein